MRAEAADSDGNDDRNEAGDERVFDRRGAARIAEVMRARTIVSRLRQRHVSGAAINPAFAIIAAISSAFVPMTHILAASRHLVVAQIQQPSFELPRHRFAVVARNRKPR
ncbi:MAG: hypothetical protein ACRED7_05355, partial [Stellaceae bacterium]